MLHQNIFLMLLGSHLSLQQRLIWVSMVITIIFWLTNVMTKHSCPLISQFRQCGPGSVLMVGLGAAWLREAARTSPNAQHRLQVFWTLVSGQEPGIHPAWRWWWRWCCHHIYVPATLPVTLWLPTKPAWSLAVAAAMYGPLNLVSQLYLPLPQPSPSTSPTACWQGLTEC